nr:hypothetical protein [Clostridia bacterium]
PNAASYSAPYLTITYTNGLWSRILVEEHENYITFALKSVSDQSIWSIAATLIEVDIDYNADSSFVATLMGMSLNTHMQEYPGRNSVLLSEAFTHIALPGVKSAVVGAPEPVLNSIMREVVNAIPDGEMPKAAYSGPFATDCPYAANTYTIMSQVTLDNVDINIEKCKKFGISQISMHQGGMYTQGDFSVPTTYYPNGADDFKAVIKKLHDNGIQVLLHSYTFFVEHVKRQKGNKYITPKPHKDLGVCARFTLGGDMTADSDIIPTVEDVTGVSTIFGYHYPPSDLIWIDDEIIRFAGVSEDGFTQIERGALGTTISEHKAGAEVKQLNSYFNYIAPEKGSELFYEIARNTAEFYNEFDFDGYYLDAIDGVFVLDSHEFAWYHAVDFINEMFKYQKKPPVFNCCYGPQYPGQWYARTRMGAFDSGHRGYRDYTDAHVAFNEKYAERMYLVGEQGWWQLYTHDESKLGREWKVMYDEDLEYICSKLLATDNCMCWHGSFSRVNDIKLLQDFSERIQVYTKLKESGYFSKEVKDIVRKPRTEFELIEVNGEYKFRYANTDMQKIESFDDGRNVIKAENKFGEQKPRIRLEGLLTAESYDSENGMVIGNFDENVPVQLNTPIEVGNVDTKGNLGVGVWIKGDGKGEIINIRLKSPVHIAKGNNDHFIKVDFEGWRYFNFYEYQNCEMKPEDWAPQQMEYKVYTDVRSFYAAYTSVMHYENIETINVMTNKPGDYDIRLRPIKALPEKELTLVNPSVTINGQKITFLTELKSRTFIDYYPETGKAAVRNFRGEVIAEPEVVGEAPVMVPGTNIVEVNDSSDCPYMKRTAITLRTYGETV